MPSGRRGASSLPPELWRLVAEQVSAKEVMGLSGPRSGVWLMLNKEKDSAD